MPSADTTRSPTLTLINAQSPTPETIHQLFQPYKRISPDWTVYERVKTVFTSIFFLPFRMLYLVLLSIPIVIIARLVLIGIQPSEADESSPSASGTPAIDYQNDPLFQPLSLWRRILLSVAFPIARSILFVSFGVLHVTRRKHDYSSRVAHRMPSHQSNAPAYVIVANHLGYIDILVLMATYRGSFVAKGDCERTPIIGLCARAMQCMFVRQGKSLTALLTNRIRSTYHCHQLRDHNCPACSACQNPLLIFPEGTTTNGTVMIPFRSGVFQAGLPVRPICIRFPYKHFNLSWETIRLREHVFRTMTQFYNRVECIELPVYTPSEEEVLDPRLFAFNLQHEMADVLQQDIIPLNRKHKLLYHSYLLGKETDELSVLEKARTIFNSDDQLQHFVKSCVEDKV